MQAFCFLAEFDDMRGTMMIKFLTFFDTMGNKLLNALKLRLTLTTAVRFSLYVGVFNQFKAIPLAIK